MTNVLIHICLLCYARTPLYGQNPTSLSASLSRACCKSEQKLPANPECLRKRVWKKEGITKYHVLADHTIGIGLPCKAGKGRNIALASQTRGNVCLHSLTAGWLECSLFTDLIHESVPQVSRPVFAVPAQDRAPLDASTWHLRVWPVWTLLASPATWPNATVWRHVLSKSRDVGYYKISSSIYRTQSINGVH